MAKKKELITELSGSHQPANPSDIFKQVAQSDADVTEAYSKVPGGRFSAKKVNYPGGVQHMEMTSVPDVEHKYELKQAVKQMKKDGLEMEEIARKLGISTSYAYQLNRE